MSAVDTLTAVAVPFSSTVGKSVMFTGPGGAVVAQIAIMVPSAAHDYRETAEALAAQVIAAWNSRAPVSANVVPVKLLVWKWDRTAWSADGGGVCYRVAEVHGEWMWFESPHKWDEELSIRKGRSASCNAAKAKAQKLHEARVRSLIGGA